MVAFLKAHVRDGGEAKRGRCWSDHHNNVFIFKGSAEHYPCVAAHIDTVHPMKPVSIVQEGDRLFGLDTRGQRSGIGADDKAGVLICLELLERFDNIAVVLFAGEEIGCAGARQADPAFFGRLGYVVEFDAPSYGLVSHSSGGQRLFANRGQFIHTALPVLERNGAANFQRHPFSDVMAVRERFPLSCLNLSAGYYQWHRPDEFVVLDEVASMLEVGAELVQALGCRHYPLPVGAVDNDPPIMTVRELCVPEARSSRSVHNQTI